MLLFKTVNLLIPDAIEARRRNQPRTTRSCVFFRQMQDIFTYREGKPEKASWAQFSLCNVIAMSFARDAQGHRETQRRGDEDPLNFRVLAMSRHSPLTIHHRP